MGRNTKKARYKAPLGAAEEHDGPSGGDDLGAEAQGEERQARRGLLPEVVHREESLVVLNKPAGLRADGRTSDLPSAVGRLVSSGCVADDEPLGAAYPLDCDASGVLVVARGADILDHLHRQIAEGGLELRYLALVRGRPGGETGTINHPLFDPGAVGGTVRPDEEHGEAAITEWRLRELYIGFALLECVPRTAVRSQIRAHLQAAGMPLIVDPRYGGGDKLLLSSFKADYRASRRREERPLIARLTLHAQSVRFAHPLTGKNVLFETPLPKDMRAAIHQLDRFGRVPGNSE
jgi:23S rRNA-/tRNA-specific pseudouridylate synthase